MSWQIIPNALGRLIGAGDASASKRVMEAMFQMDKLEVKRLQEAFDGA